MNKQTLAREILALEKDARLLYNPELTLDLFKRYPLLAACISCKAIQLAQLVLEEDIEGFQSHIDSITKTISIEEEIAKAKQEQKEKDAGIAESFEDHHPYCNGQSKVIAKAIRAS